MIFFTGFSYFLCFQRMPLNDPLGSPSSGDTESASATSSLCSDMLEGSSYPSLRSYSFGNQIKKGNSTYIEHVLKFGTQMATTGILKSRVRNENKPPLLQLAPHARP